MSSRSASPAPEPPASPGPGLGDVADDVAAIGRELRDYRELLRALARRDLILRYKHSYLGFGWAVFVPLLHMLVFTVIFTRVARLDTGMPYPVYAYAGLLPWNLFASAVGFGAVSLTDNKDLVTKVWFPRELFPLAAVLVALVDFLVASVLLAALMAWYGVAPSWTILFLPVVLLVEIAFTLGVALLFSMANVYFRDARYLLNTVLTVWMLATSVVYPVERIGGRLGDVLALNPMTPIVDGFRTVLLRGRLPEPGPFLAAAAFSVLLCVGSWLWFHRSEGEFAQVI